MAVFCVLSNYCIYESAWGLESIHDSKVGAYKSMRKKAYEHCQKIRNDSLMYGLNRGFVDSGFGGFKIESKDIETHPIDNCDSKFNYYRSWEFYYLGIENFLGEQN